jgi:hypothetical protein
MAGETDEAMPIRVVMTMRPAWVADAFVAAVGRAKAGAAADVETARGVSVPVAEALMWIDALQQTTREVGRARDEAKELARDPLVRALTFVRWRVHHHWAPVAQFDADATEWVWLRAENLPLPPKQRHANREGEQLYKELLEGKAVIATLEDAAGRLKALI